MDRMNLRWLKYIIPDDPEQKVKLMMSYAGLDRDVADPWYTGDFETTYRDLDQSLEALLNQLLQKTSIEWVINSFSINHLNQ